MALIPQNITIAFDGIKILPSTHVKNLGLYIDRYMVFDKHINELTKKVTGILTYINRASINFDKPTREIVIQSLVLSVIRYCIKIWGSTNATLVSKVQKLQNFAARVSVGGMSKYDHVSPAYQELKWLRIEDMYLKEILITMYKAVRGLSPAWLHSFCPVSSITRTSTRQQNNIFVPRTKTDSGDRAFAIKGPKMWNALSSEITNSTTLNTFKHRLMERFPNDKYPI